MPVRGNILSLSTPDLPETPSSSDLASTEDHAVCAADTLSALIHIIRESGMDPITQLAGYLTTDDPTYLPDNGHARLLADRVGRDKLLEALIEAYLHGSHATEPRA